jgi:hypothetical protein
MHIFNLKKLKLKSLKSIELMSNKNDGKINNLMFLFFPFCIIIEENERTVLSI